MNKQDKILLKLSEEMSELLTRILQHLNKEKDYKDKSCFTLSSQNNVIAKSTSLQKVINYLKKPYLKLIK